MEAAPDIKEGVEEAEPKNVKPPRELTTEELDAKLVRENNMDKAEVLETNEVIENGEALEEDANNGKDKVIKKHDANKEDEVSEQEKEIMET